MKFRLEFQDVFPRAIFIGEREGVQRDLEHTIQTACFCRPAVTHSGLSEHRNRVNVVAVQIAGKSNGRKLGKSLEIFNEKIIGIHGRRKTWKSAGDLLKSLP